MVSDPGNKKGVAGVKMPGPGQLVCSEGCSEPKTNESVIQPDPLAPPDSPAPSSSLGLQEL